MVLPAHAAFPVPDIFMELRCCLEQYVGQTLTDEYLETDLRDEIEEALKVNQYITGIDDYAFERTGSNITVSFSVQTLFGSIKEEYDVNL